MSIIENISSLDGTSLREEIIEPQVEVQFLPMITLEESTEELFINFNNPQIITWFLGRMGLKENWLIFFRDNILRPIRSFSSNSRFFLYDLRNWMLYKKNFPTFDQTKKTRSRIMERIENLRCQDIVCLDSLKYFQFLTNCNDVEMTRYANEIIWQRDFIWIKSQETRSAGISIMDSFGSSFPLLSSIEEMDVQQAYSALQYMEAYFCIREMIKKRINDVDYIPEERIDIIFLLPNDETSSYRKEELEEDVKNMLNKDDSIPSNINIKISFIPFQWGDDIRSRPYLTKGSAVKLGGGIRTRPYLTKGNSIKGQNLKLLDTLRA